MLVDYHTHHYRCGHAVGTLREYIEQGIKLGIDQIGVSDHMPIIHLPKDKMLKGIGMEVDELENYVKEAVQLKEEYKRDIDVKVGLEADYIPKYEQIIADLLSPYPFDYIIGSVHFLGEWDFSDSRQMHGWRKRPIDEIFEEYFRTVQGAAKSGLYHIIGHFDVIKKYGHAPNRDISSLVSETLEVIKREDMTMEINTSGLKLVEEVYPSPKIITEAAKLNIPFTIGSDAHKPEHVLRDFEVAKSLLEKNGIEQIAVFANGMRSMIFLR